MYYDIIRFSKTLEVLDCKQHTAIIETLMIVYYNCFQNTLNVDFMAILY